MKIVKTNTVKEKKKKPLIKYWILLILAQVFLFAMPVELLYMKGGFLFSCLEICCFLVVVPYCLYTILNQLFNDKIGAAGISIIFILNLICWPYVSDLKEMNYLQAHGKWVTGEVVDTKYVSTKRGDGWEIKVKYKGTNEFHTSNWERTGYLKTYEIGDRLKVIYSEKYPTLFRIEDDWQDEIK